MGLQTQQETKGSASSGWYAPPRGTHGPGSQGGSPATRGAAESMAVEEDIRKEEEALLGRNSLGEAAVIFSTSGEVLIRKSPIHKDRVFFDDHEKTRLKDAILAHNHPTGVGLSREDLIFASMVDLAEIRAVAISPFTDEMVVYRMTRPPGGWPKWARMSNYTGWAHKDAMDFLTTEIAEGRLDEEDYSLLIGHERAQRLVQIVADLDYDVEIL